MLFFVSALAIACSPTEPGVRLPSGIWPARANAPIDGPVVFHADGYGVPVTDAISVVVEQRGAEVAGTLSIGGSLGQGVWTPAKSLEANTRYEVTIRLAAKHARRDESKFETTFAFTTGAHSVDKGRAPTLTQLVATRKAYDESYSCANTSSRGLCTCDSDPAGDRLSITTEVQLPDGDYAGSSMAFVRFAPTLEALATATEHQGYGRETAAATVDAALGPVSTWGSTQVCAQAELAHPWGDRETLPAQCTDIPTLIGTPPSDNRLGTQPPNSEEIKRSAHGCDAAAPREFAGIVILTLMYRMLRRRRAADLGK